jgi:hypothetical protein
VADSERSAPGERERRLRFEVVRAIWAAWTERGFRGEEAAAAVGRIADACMKLISGSALPGAAASTSTEWCDRCLAFYPVNDCPRCAAASAPTTNLVSTSGELVGGAAASGREDEPTDEQIEAAYLASGYSPELGMAERLLPRRVVRRILLAALRARAAPRPGGEGDLASQVFDAMQSQAAKYDIDLERSLPAGLLFALASVASLTADRARAGAGASEPREAEGIVDRLLEAEASGITPFTQTERRLIAEVRALRAAERGAASGETGASHE